MTNPNSNPQYNPNNRPTAGYVQPPTAAINPQTGWPYQMANPAMGVPAGQAEVYNQNMNNANYYNYNNNSYANPGKPNRVSYNDFNAGDRLIVEGEVTFSRITSYIDGDELVEYQRNSKSAFRQEKPFITITLRNPKVSSLNQAPNTAGYIQTNSYLSKGENPVPLIRFKVNGASDPAHRTLPDVYINLNQSMNGNPSLAPFTPTPGMEFAEGTPVTVCLRIFDSKSANKGAAIESIICHENPPRFYNVKAGKSRKFLENLGFSISDNSETIQPKVVETPNNMGNEYEMNGMDNGYNGYGYNNGFANGVNTGYAQPNQQMAPYPSGPNPAQSTYYPNQAQGNPQQVPYQADYNNYPSSDQPMYDPSNDPKYRNM